MNDFRERLVEKYRADYGLGTTFRTFARLDFGPFSVSIQASDTHYCTPRETLPEGDTSYSAWEVAVFRDEEWISRDDEEVFGGLACRDEWESGNRGVGGYIETVMVQELCDRLALLALAPTTPGDEG